VFIFGHLGIGSKLVSPATKGLPWRWVLLGTLLPDLIDKTLFYAQKSLVEGEIPLVTGTRTFGHTASLTLTLTAFAWARHSKLCAALALGTLSHQLLDIVLDKILRASEPSALIAFLWPIFGPNKGQFAIAPFENIQGHLQMLNNGAVIGAEILGTFLLFAEWRKRKTGQRGGEGFRP
jgi:hypothetical protein